MSKYRNTGARLPIWDLFGMTLSQRQYWYSDDSPDAARWYAQWSLPADRVVIVDSDLKAAVLQHASSAG